MDNESCFSKLNPPQDTYLSRKTRTGVSGLSATRLTSPTAGGKAAAPSSVRGEAGRQEVSLVTRRKQRDVYLDVHAGRVSRVLLEQPVPDDILWVHRDGERKRHLVGSDEESSLRGKQPRVQGDIAYTHVSSRYLVMMGRGRGLWGAG